MLHISSIIFSLINIPNMGNVIEISCSGDNSKKLLNKM